MFSKTKTTPSDSFERKFKWSLFYLTFQYTVTLASILIISGAVSYSTFFSRLNRRFPPPPPPGVHLPPPAGPTLSQVRTDFLVSLVVVNGALFLIAGLFSYWLAKVTLRPIRDAYKRQQQFLGDASHELRTPLSILQISLENELADALPGSLSQKRTESNLEEVRRMSKLVSDLLILSRLDEQPGQKPKKNWPRLAVPVLLDSIVTRLEPLAQTQNVRLALEPMGGHLMLHTNEQELARALTNVIQNAIYYNKPGGLVSVSAGEQKSNIRIRVADTGIGIAAEDLRNIFNRFYRSDKSRSRKSGGSGLGLAIAQLSIEQLGGSLSIESELGRGTTVTVLLPKP